MRENNSKKEDIGKKLIEVVGSSLVNEFLTGSKRMLDSDLFKPLSFEQSDLYEILKSKKTKIEMNSAVKIQLLKEQLIKIIDDLGLLVKRDELIKKQNNLKN
jgi:hypothetical protein